MVRSGLATISSAQPLSAATRVPMVTETDCGPPLEMQQLIPESGMLMSIVLRRRK
jgi:hypothetical protein